MSMNKKARGNEYMFKREDVKNILYNAALIDSKYELFDADKHRYHRLLDGNINGYSQKSVKKYKRKYDSEKKPFNFK